MTLQFTVTVAYNLCEVFRAPRMQTALPVVPNERQMYLSNRAVSMDALCWTVLVKSLVFGALIGGAKA